MQECRTSRMGGRGSWISNTSSGQGFSLGWLTVDCVMNRSGSRSRTEAGAIEGEVDCGVEEREQEQEQKHEKEHEQELNL